MTLGRILQGVHVSKMVQRGFGQAMQLQDIAVRAIQYDSRRVERNDVFVAIRGATVDGHKFIHDAVGRGAVAVVLEEDAEFPDAFFMHAGVTKIVVQDTRRVLATMARNFFGDPSRSLRLIGVTGTNGKTTTTHLIRSVLETSGERVGLIGTIGYHTGREEVEAIHTTPESVELNELLATMISGGCSSAVMEVSSHALSMRRVEGLEFAAAVFTNLTQDHLDFHGSMEGYFAAKQKLFDSLPESSWAVSNADDPYGARMISSTAGKRLTFGIDREADVVATKISGGLIGTTMEVNFRGAEQQVTSALIGRFNAENILAAYAVCAGLGVESTQIAQGIRNLTAVRGRFEQVRSPAGWMAVVDYAHTPDALEHCLKTIRELTSGSGNRVITIFGCGGNRDRTKRKVMGAVVARDSDIMIVTSDNPRNEDPATIIDEVLQGIPPGTSVRTEIDRRKAIEMGLALAQPGDVVLIAGKGHETYQIIGSRKEHFDDKEEVERYIARSSWKSTQRIS